ncbi:MAG: peptidoglycan DD-metalloendopeptidase family protein [Desulfotomaculales bacterium]
MSTWHQAKPWAVPPFPSRGARRFARAGKRRTKNPLGLAIVLVCLVTLALAVFAHRSAVWAVEVDGRCVAAVEDVAKAEAALAELDRTYTAGDIEWRHRVRVVRAWGAGPVSDDTDLAERLARSLGLLVSGTALKIDGEEKLVFSSRTTAEMFLSYLTKSYLGEANAKAEFLEQVELADVTVPVTRITDIHTALQKVAGKKEATETYTVRPGDTSWDIAAAFGITPSELAAANPGIDLERLQIGQTLNISREKPLLTLVTTEEITRIETVPAPLQVRRDPNLYIGQQKVVQPGKSGRKEVTYLVTRHNGVEVARKELASKVIAEPVPRIVARGSRLMLASRFGGQLAWPAQGYVSSRFGMRWGGFHAGVDIAAGYGSPVGAAEAGRVVYAGWRGAYGRVVEISHGGGVTTVYAHLSRIVVSVGQEVNRGQVLGYVGTSGNATGPHVHFEVRVNGNPQDPLKYL